MQSRPTLSRLGSLCLAALVIVATVGGPVAAAEVARTPATAAGIADGSRGGATTESGLGTVVAQSNETVEVIVRFTNESARAAATFDGANVTVTGGRDIAVSPVLFARATRDAIERLRERRTVTAVIVDRPVTVPPGKSNRSTVDGSKSGSPSPPVRAGSEGDDGTGTDGQTVPWGVSRVGAPAVVDAVPATARDTVTVAVLDTGINYTHPDLNGSVAWGVDVTGSETTYGREAAIDRLGHGTAVAGLLAAQDNDRGIVGVAPGTSLYSVQVLRDDGTGTLTSLVEGIDAAVKGPDRTLGTGDDADVLSMSLASDTDTNALSQVIEDVRDHAFLVAAAGNTGDGNVSTDEVTYPADYPAVIAVANADRANDTRPTSAEGGSVELAAPGYQLPTLEHTGGTRVASGTSMAAPFVAGGLALLLAADRADGSRDRSRSALRRRLQTTARDIESDGFDRRSGFGLLQVDTAADGLLPTTTLTGTVRTVDGRVVANATITLSRLEDAPNATVARADRSVATSTVAGTAGSVATTVATTTTDSAGHYRFENLTLGGAYRIAVASASGPATERITDLRIGTTVANVVVPAGNGTRRTNATDPPVTRSVRSTDGSERNLTVTVEATVDSPTVSVSESFRRSVAAASVRAVTVEGGAVNPVVAGATRDGVAVVVDDPDEGDGPVRITVRYRVTLPINATGGGSGGNGGSGDNGGSGGSGGSGDNGADRIGAVPYLVDGTVTTTNRTLTPGTDRLVPGSSSPLSGSPAIYDADADGAISLAELGTAAADFAGGSLSLDELAAVAGVYARTE